MMTENEDLDGNWCAEDFCQNWWILSNIQPEDSEDGDDCETFSGVFDRESSGREVPACSDHLLLVKAVVENPKLSFQRATTQKCGIPIFMQHVIMKVQIVILYIEIHI